MEQQKEKFLGYRFLWTKQDMVHITLKIKQ